MCVRIEDQSFTGRHMYGCKYSQQYKYLAIQLPSVRYNLYFLESYIWEEEILFKGRHIVSIQ